MPKRTANKKSLGRKAAPRQRSTVVTYDTVKRLGARFPEVEEETSWGTPALKVRGKLMVRLREDGETLVVRTDFVNRDLLLRTFPDTVFLTDHYRNYPYLLVHLPRVKEAQLGELLEDAWRLLAPKRLVAQFDGKR